MRDIYIDSSAILKLIIREKESEAVISIPRARFITSEISRVEVTRAILRYEPKALKIAEQVFKNLNFVKIDSQTLVQAERLPERISIRALDAIHIAVASKMGLRISSVLTYDKQMAKAAKALGFEVLAPVETMKEEL
jgi:predicted nucleic acid-binding protein